MSGAHLQAHSLNAYNDPDSAQSWAETGNSNCKLHVPNGGQRPSYLSHHLFPRCLVAEMENGSQSLGSNRGSWGVGS